MHAAQEDRLRVLWDSYEGDAKRNDGRAKRISSHHAEDRGVGSRYRRNHLLCRSDGKCVSGGGYRLEQTQPEDHRQICQDGECIFYTRIWNLTDENNIKKCRQNTTYIETIYGFIFQDLRL